MADMIQAYQAYSPRAKIESNVNVELIIEYIAGRTGLNTGELFLVLMELRDSLFYYTRTGNSVKLPGLGSFSPTMDKDGIFGINHRPDKWIIDNLNAKSKYIGKIRNKDMIGKSAKEFKKRWNREHPEDKIKK
ncbi:MAG: hypothetical protein GY950_01580 [bacterium]|nr:hypothetical protein [bacterium]